MLVKMMLNKILRTVSTLVILDMHDTKKEDCFGYRMEKNPPSMVKGNGFSTWSCFKIVKLFYKG